MLEMLKRILGITDNSQDALLTELLLEAQGYVEDFIDYKLDLADYTDEISAYARDTIVLRNFPVKAVAQITDQNGNSCTGYRLVKSKGLIRGTFFNGDYEIEYQAGYEELPGWAKKAITDTASYLYSQVGSGGVTGNMIKSEEVFGVAKVTYETSTTNTNEAGELGGILPLSVVDLLEKHANRYA